MMTAKRFSELQKTANRELAFKAMKLTVDIGLDLWETEDTPKWKQDNLDAMLAEMTEDDFELYNEYLEMYRDA